MSVPKSWRFAGQGILTDDDGSDENEIVLADLYDEPAARLIAAAPDLYAALRLILPLAEAFLLHAPTHPDNAKLEDARAALVKAVRG